MPTGSRRLHLNLSGTHPPASPRGPRSPTMAPTWVYLLARGSRPTTPPRQRLRNRKRSKQAWRGEPCRARRLQASGFIHKRKERGTEPESDLVGRKFRNRAAPSCSRRKQPGKSQTGMYRQGAKTFPACFGSAISRGTTTCAVMSAADTTVWNRIGTWSLK